MLPLLHLDSLSFSFSHVDSILGDIPNWDWSCRKFMGQGCQCTTSGGQGLARYSTAGQTRCIRKASSNHYEKQELCLQRKWKLKKRNGEVVFLRDVLGKVAKSVSRFREVGAVAVQYDPSHAALPWAGVRLVLLAMVNDIQTHNAVAEGLEQICTLIARYAMVEGLYLHINLSVVEQLVDSLVSLYAAVLNFLSRAIRYYSRNTGERIARSLVQTTETSVDSYLQKISQEETRVDQIAHLIDSDGLRKVTLFMQDGFIGLHGKLDGLGHKLGRLQMSVDGQFLTPSVGRKELVAWIDAVFTDDEFERALSARLEGTCDWILQQDVFRAWADSGNLIDETRVLRIHGPAGFGKTILCARIVAYLSQKPIGPVAHLFCIGADEAKRQPQAIVRSWVAQILNQNELAVELTASYYKGKEARKATEADVWHLFKKLSLNAGPCFFLIDGYDECMRSDLGSGYSSDIQINFLQRLAAVIADTGSWLLLVSRYDPSIRNQLQSASGEPNKSAFYEYEITPEDTKEDITSFSHSMVEQELPNEPSLLKKELALEAARRCDGMFLWIKLMHIRLSPGKNAKQLREVVRVTPAGLDQAYEKDLRTILALETNESIRAVSILRWTLFALRPLTVKELTEALLIRDSDTCGQFPADDLPDAWDEYYTDDQIRKLCGSLIELRSTESHQEITAHTVHFVHFSVKEYLTSTIDVSIPNVRTLRFSDVEYENSLLARKCLRYLCYEDFRVHDISSQESLKSKTDQYALLLYATRGWYQHVSAGGHHSRDLDAVINKFFDPRDFRWLLWSEILEIDAISFEEFHSCCRNGYPGLVYYASLLRLTRTVEYLTSQGLDLNAKGGMFGSALQAAAFNHDTDTVEFLLQKNADVNIGGGKYRSAVVAAAARRQVNHSGKNVIRLLLEGGAYIESRDELGWTALHWAAYNGNLNIIRLLCKYKADHRVVSDRGETPLFMAAAHGYKDVINILFDLGSDVKHLNRNRETALHYASSHGHSSVIKLLLDHGREFGHPIKTEWPAPADGGQQICEIDAIDDMGQTPLHMATKEGHESAVKLLLKHKANLEITGRDGCTPLGTAVKQRHKTIVKLLVHAGAKTDVVHELGWIPLLAAVDLGDEDISNYLLDAGADPNLSPELSPPLHHAIWRNRIGLVDSLLLYGANPLMVDGFGRTAMDWAASNKLGFNKMLPYCANYQQLNEARSFENVCRTIGAIVEKLKIEKFHSAFFTNLLGHYLLLIDDVKEAGIAFQQVIDYASEDGTLNHPGICCDNCSDEDDSIKGERFICCQCADTDACKACMNMHLENSCLPACNGHDFLKIPRDGWQRPPDGKVNAFGESLDEWLMRIQEKYSVSKLTESRLASDSGPEKNESQSQEIDSNS